MLNFLYNQAPRDGTAIGMIQNGFPAAQAIGRPGIQFDANQLRWLGTIAPVVETMAVWHTAGVQQHRRRAQEGDRRRGHRARRHHLHLSRADERAARHQFKIVTGYTGGNEINIAMERGEVQGAQQFLVELEGHQDGVAQGEEALRHRAGRRQGERSRRARDRGSRQDRARTASSSTSSCRARRSAGRWRPRRTSRSRGCSALRAALPGGDEGPGVPLPRPPSSTSRSIR